MTITFSVDINNDLYIGTDGNLSISAGLQATLQACEQASKTKLGEMVLNTDQGLPFETALWNGNPNLAQFEAALRGAITNVPGVVRILEISIQVSENTLSYVVSILTTYGPGNVSDVLII